MARRESEHNQLPIPNGWFAVEFSRELHDGDVKPIHYCDEDLVLFRTRSGQAKVLDAFCPHLGAHIGYGGRVMGETVRCPFHAWQFDGTTGDCSHIPYSERIPATAKLRAWDVQEKNGFIWIWYHAEGKPPEWDFPEQPVFDPTSEESADWSEPRTFDVVLDAHIQDTHENNNDPVHFLYVHSSSTVPESEIHYTPDSTHYRISTTNEIDYPFGTFTMTLVRDSWGLGLNCMSMEGIPGAGLMMFAATTPIDEKSVHSRWLLTASNNMVDLAGEEFMKGVTDGIEQDFDIWKHKVHRANPVFCEGDHYLGDYRKWARQFYSNPVGEVRKDKGG
jgi:phenylpropionate dioxygenase-like ring-hydroxylating dioxygenase large terminal subunit